MTTATPKLRDQNARGAGGIGGMLGMLYATIAYFGFLTVYVAFAVWAAGAVAPYTVDTAIVPLGLPVGAAVAVNLALILVFAVQHTIMARSGFKAWITRFIPSALERSTFVLVSTLLLAAIIVLWQPIPTMVWRVENEGARIVLWSVQALGWVLVPVASFMIDHFDLFGLKQAFLNLRARPYRPGGFAAPLLYRYVRHPMMLGFIIAFYSVPEMTVGHLVLSLGMTAYIHFGTRVEERDLVVALGDDYRRYQKSTPRLIPGIPMPGESSQRKDD